MSYSFSSIDTTINADADRDAETLQSIRKLTVLLYALRLLRNFNRNYCVAANACVEKLALALGTTKHLSMYR